MKTFVCKIAAVAMAILTSGSIALAQDRCEDVLINKVMDTQEYKRDGVFLLTLATQSTDYLKNATSMKTGLDFAIDGIPIGVTSDNANQFERQITRSLNLTAFQRDNVYYLLQSGQKNIIDAWSDCMSQRGGLVLTFESQNEYRGVLHIDYLVPKGTFSEWPDLTLQEDVPIPANFKINTGMDCLKRQPGKSAHVFKRDSRCDVDFELPADWTKDRAAWTIWSVVLRAKTSSKQLSFSTYLAPRTKLVARSKVWPASPPMQMAGLYAFDHGVASALDCKSSDAGYVFLQNKFKLQPVEWGHGGGRCRVNTAAVQDPGTAFCITSALGGIYESGDYYCRIDVTGTEIKWEFDPAEPNAKPADYLAFSLGKPLENEIASDPAER